MSVLSFQCLVTQPPRQEPKNSQSNDAVGGRGIPRLPMSKPTSGTPRHGDMLSQNSSVAPGPGTSLSSDTIFSFLCSSSLTLPPLSPLPLCIHLCVFPSGCCAPLHSLSAPSSSGSAKGGGAPWPGGAQTYSPSPTCRYRSLAQPATTRLSSVSSHDSGFVSQDATYSKPPSPMPSDITSQVRGHWEDHVGGEPEPHADLTQAVLERGSS